MIIHINRKAKKRQTVASLLRHGAYSGQRRRRPTGKEGCRVGTESKKGWSSSLGADIRANNESQ